MTNTHGPAASDVSTPPRVSERPPVMQTVCDNPFLLLFIGVAVPAVFYLIWGIMDIVLIPIAR
jgi:hypothetical protein